jgi:hypothetical protein
MDLKKIVKKTFITCALLTTGYVAGHHYGETDKINQYAKMHKEDNVSMQIQCQKPGVNYSLKWSIGGKEYEIEDLSKFCNDSLLKNLSEDSGREIFISNMSNKNYNGKVATSEAYEILDVWFIPK